MNLKYLCMLNINRDVLHPNSRDSFLAAARRWGAQYVEIVSRSAVHEHHFMQKLSVHEWFPDGARVCCLDADTVIRSDCPDLFEMVPEHELGLVRSWQPGHECGHQTTVNGAGNMNFRNWILPKNGTMADCFSFPRVFTGPV